MPTFMGYADACSLHATLIFQLLNIAQDHRAFLEAQLRLTWLASFAAKSLNEQAHA